MPQERLVDKQPGRNGTTSTTALNVLLLGREEKLCRLSGILSSLGHNPRIVDAIGDDEQADLVIADAACLASLERLRREHESVYLVATEVGPGAPLNHVDVNATAREVELAVELAMSSGERERRLAESERQLEAIFANSQVGIMLLTGYRRLARCNDRMAEIAGFDSPAQMLGISMRELHLSEQNFVEFGEQFYNNLTKNKILHIEYPIRRRDGTAVWCMLSGKALDDSPQPDLSKGVLWVVDDISHIKQAEQDLREQHELFSGGPAMVFRWLPDADWTIKSCSSNVEQVLGYSAAALIGGGIPFASLVHPDDLQRVGSEVARYLADGIDSFEQEYRLRHAQGHYLDFYDHTQVQRDEHGQVRLIYGYLLDVTQRKQDEDRLRAMDSRRKALLDISLDGIVLLNSDHGVIEANRRASSMLGYSHDEFLKLHTWDWEANLSKADILQKFPDLSRVEAQFETRHRCKDGRIIDVEISAAGKQVNGEPMVITLIRDISQRKQAEKALRDANQRFDALIASAKDGFWLVSMDGRLQDVNDAYCGYSGYGRQELVGMRIEQIDVEDDPALIAERIGRVVDTGNMIFESRHRRKDGSIWDVEISASYGPLQGGLLFVFVRDISERKQAEQARLGMERQLQQTRKMEALGQLTGGVAHEFNNMLAIISGHMALLKKQLGTHQDRKLQTYLGNMETAAGRARSMIRQMLAFSRPGESSTERIAIKPAVREALTLAQSSMPSSITISFDADSGLPDVMLDSVELQQLITNLMINARDAMQAKGHIRVELRHYQPRSAKEKCVYCHQLIKGDWIELGVADSGHGIQLEEVARVFEPFYSTKAVGKGTGLGLSVVQGIVTRAGGHILVDSEPQQGTHFRLLFPPADGSQGEEVAAADSTPRARGADTRYHLLVVDDEELLTFYFEELLADEGHQVSTCNDPIKAIEMLKSQPTAFDVLITDQTMPGLLGTELAQQARQLSPHLKIILCTGDSGLVEKGIDALHSLDHIQAKPVDPDELFAVIDDLMLKPE